jgi:hypothetical protein
LTIFRLPEINNFVVKFMSMARVRMMAAICVGGAAVLLLGAAVRPAALSRTSPGLWEISGLPNAGTAVRQCLADTALLARVEHRGQNCKQVVTSERASTAVIEYTCANGGFGRSKLTVITPRSLRIETQGISANYPFNYVIQARRVGNCQAH